MTDLLSLFLLAANYLVDSLAILYLVSIFIEI